MRYLNRSKRTLIATIAAASLGMVSMGSVSYGQTYKELLLNGGFSTAGTAGLVFADWDTSSTIVADAAVFHTAAPSCKMHSTTATMSAVSRTLAQNFEGQYNSTDQGAKKGDTLAASLFMKASKLSAAYVCVIQSGYWDGVTWSQTGWGVSTSMSLDTTWKEVKFNFIYASDSLGITDIKLFIEVKDTNTYWVDDASIKLHPYVPAGVRNPLRAASRSMVVNPQAMTVLSANGRVVSTRPVEALAPNLANGLYFANIRSAQGRVLAVK